MNTFNAEAQIDEQRNVCPYCDNEIDGSGDMHSNCAREYAMELSKVLIKHGDLKYDAYAELDELASLVDMERECPLFFKTKHGNRETYTVYRGCLIVRNTVNFTHGKERKTTVYAFFHDTESGYDLLCVSAGSKINSVITAKRLIDRMIESREHHYGM